MYDKDHNINSNNHANGLGLSTTRKPSVNWDATGCYDTLRNATGVLPDATKELLEELREKGYTETQATQIIDVVMRSGIRSGTIRKPRGNLTGEIRDWVNVSNGSFSVSNLYQDLGLVASSSMTQARVILRRISGIPILLW